MLSLAMSCTSLSTCVESDKEFTKKLILSEQNDLNLLNRKPENTVLMEKL